MRKVNVLEFVSLDGVIQAAGRPEENASGGFLPVGKPTFRRFRDLKDTDSNDF